MSDELKRDDTGGNAGDPSMEDILASIRRIIAEDGETREAEAPAAGSVLDLTEMVADDGSVVSLPPRGDTPPEDVMPEEAPVAEELPVAEAAAPELVAPEPVAPEPVAPPVPPPMAPDPSPLENFAGEEAPPALVVSREDPAMSSDVPPMDALVSGSVANQARNAFAQLADAARPPVSARGVSGEGRTVEQLAEDLLRPMLKAWLDANLPTLVERAVAQELARITGRDPK